MKKAEKTNPIRILIADDHPIFCAGLAALIDRRPDMTVVAEAHTGQEALELFRLYQPDLMLVDLRMPELSGVEVIKSIRAHTSTARIVVLTTYDGDEDIYRALQAGAQAYIIKDASRHELIDCIRSVHGGKTNLSHTVTAKLAERAQQEDLTSREREVLQLLSRGMNNREIGATLGIAEGTVKLHVTNILSKLAADNRVEAAAIALKRGILHLN
jgi:DNA-binding NarL/FixJ family response regulator